MSLEFHITFTEVPDVQQQAIRVALRDTFPPEHCIQEHSFHVIYKDGEYWIGYTQYGPGDRRDPFIGHPVESTNPVAIAEDVSELAIILNLVDAGANEFTCGIVKQGTSSEALALA